MTGPGIEGLAGAGVPPAGVRTVAPAVPTATRLVLIRHGEAVCNVSGVCGGPIGCRGLTELGRRQAEALRERLVATGELAGADAFYASVLPRAIETAELVAPGLRRAGPGGWLDPPRLVTDCGLCELHPGEADGLTWPEFGERFPRSTGTTTPVGRSPPGARAGPASSSGWPGRSIAWWPPIPTSWWSPPVTPGWWRRPCWPSCRSRVDGPAPVSGSGPGMPR